MSEYSTRLAAAPGFTQYSHALLGALMRAGLPGQHRSVFDAVMRLTLGFVDDHGRPRTKDRIAASQIAELTGLDRKAVAVMLGDLEAWKLISVEHRGRGALSVVAPQLDTTLWAVGETATTGRLRKLRARQPARSNTQVPATPNLPVRTPRPARSNTQDPARSNTHTRDKETVLHRHQNQSARTGSLKATPSQEALPSIEDITLADLRSPARCQMLWEQAVEARWGFVHGTGWAGETGRQAWFTLRAHASSQRLKVQSVVALFAGLAREGRRYGSEQDRANAKAAIAKLDRPVMERQIANVQGLGIELDRIGRRA